MKKFRYSLMALLSILFGATGCQSFEDEIQTNVESSGGDQILEAILEGRDYGRTVLSEPTDGVYKTLWAENDQIAVFIDGENNSSKYLLDSGAGTTRATFKGYGKGDSYLAVYPQEIAKDLKDKTLFVELPAEQTYAENSFGPSSFPMIAFSNSPSLTFKNTCAVLKISMTGHHNIKSIVFKANDNKTYVSGSATIDLNDMDTPVVKMQGNASNEVTLQCNGTGLKKEEATDFHIVLPAQTYKGGFTLTVYTSTGSMTKSTEEDVVLERSQLRKLTTFACKLDEGIEPSAALEGNGSQESPFLIHTLGDLLLMQGAVNAENSTIQPKDGTNAVFAQTAHYKLTQNISLAEVCGIDKGDWEPIGNVETNENFVFCGVLDGNGHSITDLYIQNEQNNQGLFGMIKNKGLITNLNITGYVKGYSYCGLIGGVNEGRIDNCLSYGSVEAANKYAGGIIGTGGNIHNCINYAEIYGRSEMVGGITGSSSSTISNCGNLGRVNSEGAYVGGIVGYQNSGRLYNCQNNGAINAEAYVGGISGYSRQGSRIYNSCNTGEVTGRQIYIGGICGLFKREATFDDYSRAVTEKSMINCVNTGVINSKGTNTGSIVGLNDATITHCYWLYDSESKQGMETGIGNNYYEESGNYPLNDKQLKNEENYHTALYKSKDGYTSYYKVLDALNAWAFDNKDGVVYEFIGWKLGDNGYPVLDNKIAEEPEGDTNPLFELSQKEFNVSSHENSISVTVAANMSYYISSIPDWITETTSTASARGVTEKVHTFTIQANPDKEERQGVIVFCNEIEQCIPVTVIQKAKVDADMAWTEKEFWHKSLGMRFTADWCGYCPRMATAFAEAQAQKPDKIEVVHMHCDGAQKFDKANTLAYQFKVEGYPTGIVDGRMVVGSTSAIIKAMEQTEKTYGTLSGIRFNSSIAEDQLTVDLELYLKASGKYKVTVLMLESGIVGYQADYTNGAKDDYVHNDVPRLALSDINGDKFETDKANVIKASTYKGTIPAKCNRDNLRILVYVQREYGSQQVISSDKYGDYYVDNSLSEKVGVEAKLKFVEE